MELSDKFSKTEKLIIQIRNNDKSMTNMYLDIFEIIIFDNSDCCFCLRNVCKV